jgi:hypothetical protein
MPAPATNLGWPRRRGARSFAVHRAHSTDNADKTMIPIRLTHLVAVMTFAAASASFGASTPAATPHLPPGIAWRQGSVDAAFAQAKESHKPLFLFWGAVWCPPCNQVKATIFTQQAFKDRSAFFIPVYLDGDSESAQKLGERFKVRGYPTMILFSPDGTEITRLPGELDATRYMQALALGMNAAHPFRQTLATASKDGARLSQDEWRMLADYSWDTDGNLPIADDKIAVTLQDLAAHARVDHAPDEALRLELKAVASAASQPPVQTGTLDKAAALDATRTVLASPKLSRSDFDVLVAYPAEITTYLSAAGSSQRVQLSKQWDLALQTLTVDPTISTADRLSALYGREKLARLDASKGATLPQSLVDTVREQAMLADKNTTNAYERQSVIDSAADTLSEAGLLDASDTLLKAELKRSATPYLFMSGLARNAKTRGDKAAALDWYRQAYAATTGPATRLRWGATYLSNVIDLSPSDDARVRAIATDLLDQVAQTPNAFYGANRRALERVVSNLVKWDRGDAHRQTVSLVTRQFQGVCDKLPLGDPQIATCRELVRPIKA